MTISDLLDVRKPGSSMRVGFLLCVIGGVFGGVGLGAAEIYFNHGTNLIGVAAIIGAILTPAFYGKQAQKKAEAANNDKVIGA